MTITVGYPPANALTSGSINSQPVVPVGANISDAGSIPVMSKFNPLTGGSIFSAGGADQSETLARLPKTNIKIRPGTVVFPRTTSVAAGGWSITADGLLSSGAVQFNGAPSTRITNAVPASTNYPVIRRKVPASMVNSATGTIEIPFYMPPGIGVGSGISITISSDVPAADPPTAAPTNYQRWSFPNSQFRPGVPQTLRINPLAVLANSPEMQDSTVWATGGTNDPYSTLQIAISFTIPAGSADPWFEIGDISFGASSTPVVLFGFDGAGSDADHIKYVLPLLDKYGIKAFFSVQGQVPGQSALYANNVLRIAAAGHDIACEGMNHTNYSTTPSALLADVATAKANFAAIGITRGVSTIFAAPNNSLKSGTLPAVASAAALSAGITDLIAAGFRFIRCGSKMLWSPVEARDAKAVVVAAVPGDQALAADMIKWLDATETDGAAVVLFLFHDVTNPGGTAGALQTKYEELDALLLEFSNRRSRGRMINVSPTELVASCSSALGISL